MELNRRVSVIVILGAACLGAMGLPSAYATSAPVPTWRDTSGASFAQSGGDPKSLEERRAKLVRAAIAFAIANRTTVNPAALSALDAYAASVLSPDQLSKFQQSLTKYREGVADAEARLRASVNDAYDLEAAQIDLEYVRGYQEASGGSPSQQEAKRKEVEDTIGVKKRFGKHAYLERGAQAQYDRDCFQLLEALIEDTRALGVPAVMDRLSQFGSETAFPKQGEGGPPAPPGQNPIRVGAVIEHLSQCNALRDCVTRLQLRRVSGSERRWEATGEVGAVLEQMNRENELLLVSWIQHTIEYLGRFIAAPTIEDRRAMLARQSSPTFAFIRQINDVEARALVALATALDQQCSSLAADVFRGAQAQVLAPQYLRTQWLERDGWGQALAAAGGDPAVEKAVNDVLFDYTRQLAVARVASRSDLARAGDPYSEDHLGRASLEIQERVETPFWRIHDAALASIAVALGDRGAQWTERVNKLRTGKIERFGLVKSVGGQFIPWRLPRRQP